MTAQSTISPRPVLAKLVTKTYVQREYLIVNLIFLSGGEIMEKFYLWAVYLIYSWTTILVHGEDGTFVVTTEENSQGRLNKKEGIHGDLILPKIYEMRIDSNITNRFARTLITSKVKNLNDTSKETTFSVILPDKAFISEFVMVIGDKSYKAYVKEKQEAKNIYDQAVVSGTGAAHVAVTARESNRFTVSVNIEARSKVTFLLTYEELLTRKDNMYELIINIHPKQPVKNLYVTVLIDESRPLKFVKTPPLRSGNEITKGDDDLDPRSKIDRVTATSAIVSFKPDIKRQQALASSLGTDLNEGLAGQFVVQYDVARDPSGGEVLVQDGYFVHFFAPTDVKPLNKFIIFVLDTSGSMWGQKLLQLKAAMTTILDQLDVNDYFHIVGFQSNTTVVNINNPKYSTPTSSPNSHLREVVLNYASSGVPDNIKKAKDAIAKLEARGGTNINEALEIALYLIDLEKDNGVHKNLPQPIIMFLTDGEPTVGVTNKTQIALSITAINNNQEKTPFFSLSFGDDADKSFLKKLSLQNQGFSRHIYEASDAALQLGSFYKEIASPLLRDVKFEYVPETVSLTKTNFPIYFGGSEIVVSGKLSGNAFSEEPKVSCVGGTGPIVLHPQIQRPVTSLERLWAYLTVQQLLDDREIAANKTISEKKALNLALEYSFVTPVSSLVVVKPNSTNLDVDPVAADKGLDELDDSDFKIGGGFIDFTKPVVLPEPLPAPPPFVFSSLPPEAPFQSNKTLSDLETILPWLSSILNEDGTLKSPEGGYQVGLNETISSFISCPRTPTNTTGNCTLLHKCPQVHSLLTSVNIFLNFFCPINHKFAGICCPS